MSADAIRDLWSLIYNQWWNRKFPSNSWRLWVMENFFPDRPALDPSKDIVAVVGAEYELGADIVEQFVAAGYTTIGFVSNMPDDEDMVEGVTYYAVSLWEAASVNRAVASAVSEIGTITAFVNCADVAVRLRLVTDYDQEYDPGALVYNTASNQFFAGAIIPGMIREGRGYYVDIISPRAWASPAWLSDIGTAEAYKSGFHSALTYDLGGYVRPRSGVHTLLMTTKNRDISQVPQDESALVRTYIYSSRQAAQSLIQAMEWGTIGSIASPFWYRWMPWMRVLPGLAVMAIRSWSNYDKNSPEDIAGSSTQQSVVKHSRAITSEPDSVPHVPILSN
jgi:NAD(P)-dependent dehydrogenase (short-subunit alcohol dehydrogenase family)